MYCVLCYKRNGLFAHIKLTHVFRGRERIYFLQHNINENFISNISKECPIAFLSFSSIIQLVLAQSFDKKWPSVNISPSTLKKYFTYTNPLFIQVLKHMHLLLTLNNSLHQTGCDK